MTESDDDLVPVFIPALVAVLIMAEDKKGKPLSYEEVVRVRDGSPCIMMTVADARKHAESRGADLDPEAVWYDWQMFRRESGRKPDLDPGPKFQGVRSADPEYQRTIHDARAGSARFREMLSQDGTPRFDAMIKTTVTQGADRAFMWLSNTRLLGSEFVAEFFEVPNTLSDYHVGDRLTVTEDSLLDWMVNDDGVLYGGFSIRYQRSQLPEVERAAYDEYIGVTKYT